MPKITIFRGLPGSGKTTAARRLQALTGAIMLEPDMMCVRDNQYIYNKSIYKFHIRSISHIITRVIFADMIISDVLPYFKSFEELLYVPMAHILKRDYSLELVEMPTLTLEESLERNTHNVRREDIERMIAEYQPLDEVCDNLRPLFLSVKGVKLFNHAGIENYFKDIEKEVKND